MQYTGQLWLPDFGVYHYKARAYNLALGRFMQTDPVGYEEGLNLYAYVGNDPVNGTDPTGMVACPPMGCDDGPGMYRRHAAPEVPTDPISLAAEALIMEPLRAVSRIVDDLRSSRQPSLGDVVAVAASVGLPGRGRAAGTAASSSGVRRALGEAVEAVASSPVGRRGSPMNVWRGTNAPGEVGGRQYTGHAFDQMQGRGIPPSAVENSVQVGRASPDPIAGRTRHYDAGNNMTVVTETNSGRVITVVPGRPR